MVKEAVLLGVVEVSMDRRVRCQAEGCKHSVYKAIHIVEVKGELRLLGSQCCAKLFGWTSKDRSAAYTIGSRRLSDQERATLEANTAELVAQLRRERADRDTWSLAAAKEFRQNRSVVGSAQGPGRPIRRMLGTTLPPDIERQAKDIVRVKHGVDPDLPGWRGYVLDEAKRLQS